jgi:hypothetical protein
MTDDEMMNTELGYRFIEAACPVERLDRIGRAWRVQVGVETDDPELSGERFWCVVLSGPFAIKDPWKRGLVVQVAQPDVQYDEWHDIEDGSILTIAERHVLAVAEPDEESLAAVRFLEADKELRWISADGCRNVMHLREPEAEERETRG